MIVTLLCSLLLLCHNYHLNQALAVHVHYFIQVTTPPPDPSTANPDPTTMRVQPTLAVGDPSMPSRSPENYRLQVLNPENCSRAECDMFIGIDTNTGDDGFLDIYMEGTAEGWLAVGFSETADMVR